MIDEKNERIDDLQYNGLKLIQNPSAFCFGCDAVELANFVKKSGKNEKACDLGAGNGIISVLLAAKKGYRVTAVEIQEDAAKLCEKNAALNNLQDKIAVENMAMQDMCGKYLKGSFDTVVTNPPYSKALDGYSSIVYAKAVARHEIAVTIEEVIKTAAYLTKFGGKFYIVYPSQRLAEVLFLCTQNRLEPKVLQILTPDDKKEPHLFLLECVQSGKKGLKVLRERVVKLES